MLDCNCQPPPLGLNGFSLPFMKKKKKGPPPKDETPPEEIAPKEEPKPAPPVLVAPPPKPSILQPVGPGGKLNMPSVILFSGLAIGAAAITWYLTRKRKK